VGPYTDFMKTDLVVFESGYRREKNVYHTPITPSAQTRVQITLDIWKARC